MSGSDIAGFYPGGASQLQYGLNFLRSSHAVVAGTPLRICSIIGGTKDGELSILVVDDEHSAFNSTITDELVRTLGELLLPKGDAGDASASTTQTQANTQSSVDEEDANDADSSSEVDIDNEYSLYIDQTSLEDEDVKLALVEREAEGVDKVADLMSRLQLHTGNLRQSETTGSGVEDSFLRSDEGDENHSQGLDHAGSPFFTEDETAGEGDDGGSKGVERASSPRFTEDGVLAEDPPFNDDSGIFRTGSPAPHFSLHSEQSSASQSGLQDPLWQPGSSYEGKGRGSVPESPKDFSKELAEVSGDGEDEDDDIIRPVARRQLRSSAQRSAMTEGPRTIGKSVGGTALPTASASRTRKAALNATTAMSKSHDGAERPGDEIFKKPKARLAAKAGKKEVTKLDSNDRLYTKFGIDLSKVSGRTRQWSGIGPVLTDLSNRTLPYDPHAEPALNVLEEVDCLKEYQYGYLRDYDVLVCQSLVDGEPCGYAVPLVQLAAHSFSSTAKSAIAPRANHNLEFFRMSGKPSKEAVRALYQKIIAKYPNIIATYEELKDLRPLPNQNGPIQHIRPPVDGYQCQLCDYAQVGTIKEHTLVDHWNLHDKSEQRHRGQSILDFYDKIQVQTFDHDRLTKRFLAVQPLNNHGATSSRFKEPLPMLLADQLQLVMDDDDDEDDGSTNEIAILPFFTQIGAQKYLNECLAPPSTLFKLISLPDKEDRPLIMLKHIIISRFERLCDDLSSGNSVVRRKLVEPPHHLLALMKKRMFNPPTLRETRVSYALEEVRLICMIFRCVRSSQYSLATTKATQSKPTFQLILTKEQHDAITNLSKQLKSRSTKQPAQLQDAIDVVLESLYMPKNTTQMFRDPYINPVAVFICLRCMHPQGGWQTAKRVTPHLVKVQFGIRLFVYDYIKRTYDTYIEETESIDNDVQAPSKKHLPDMKDRQGDSEYVGQRKDVRDGSSEPGQGGVLGAAMHDLQDHWSNFFLAAIDRWASESRISPFSIVREWIHELSRVARNTPSKIMVMWEHDDGGRGQRIRLRGHEVDIHVYFLRVQKALKEFTTHLHKIILFGAAFGNGALGLPSVDNQDTTTRGFGLFKYTFTDLKELGDPAATLMSAVISNGLAKVLASGKLQWDNVKASAWLLAIEKAWSQAYVLQHLLALPGRTSEEWPLLHANTQESRRHLFLSKQTLVTVSNYHKNAHTTGIYQNIVRPMPQELAVGFGILLRVVRPVEALLVLNLRVPGNQAARMQVNNLYRTRIFVTAGRPWTATKMSNLIRAWFMDNLNVPFGVNLHRHFAQALQRELLSYEDNNPLGDAANLALGHSKRVAEMDYAKEEGTLPVPKSMQERFERVGWDWISVHGIDPAGGSSKKDKGKRVDEKNNKGETTIG